MKLKAIRSYWSKNGNRRLKPGEELIVEAGGLAEISAEVTSFCCDEMERAWADQFIDFGEFESMANKNNDVNIYVCCVYPEGAFWDEIPIRFCPFCAERIEIGLEK